MRSPVACKHAKLNSTTNDDNFGDESTAVLLKVKGGWKGLRVSPDDESVQLADSVEQASMSPFRTSLRPITSFHNVNGPSFQYVEASLLSSVDLQLPDDISQAPESQTHLLPNRRKEHKSNYLIGRTKSYSKDSTQPNKAVVSTRKMSSSRSAGSLPLPGTSFKTFPSKYTESHKRMAHTVSEANFKTANTIAKQLNNSDLDMGMGIGLLLDGSQSRMTDSISTLAMPASMSLSTSGFPHSNTRIFVHNQNEIQNQIPCQADTSMAVTTQNKLLEKTFLCGDPSRIRPLSGMRLYEPLHVTQPGERARTSVPLSERSRYAQFHLPTAVVIADKLHAAESKVGRLWKEFQSKEDEWRERMLQEALRMGMRGHQREWARVQHVLGDRRHLIETRHLRTSNTAIREKLSKHAKELMAKAELNAADDAELAKMNANQRLIAFRDRDRRVAEAFAARMLEEAERTLAVSEQLFMRAEDQYSREMEEARRARERRKSMRERRRSQIEKRRSTFLGVDAAALALQQMNARGEQEARRRAECMREWDETAEMYDEDVRSMLLQQEDRQRRDEERVRTVAGSRGTGQPPKGVLGSDEDAIELERRLVRLLARLERVEAWDGVEKNSRPISLSERDGASESTPRGAMIVSNLILSDIVYNPLLKVKPISMSAESLLTSMPASTCSHSAGMFLHDDEGYLCRGDECDWIQIADYVDTEVGSLFYETLHFEDIDRVVRRLGTSYLT